MGLLFGNDVDGYGLKANERDGFVSLQQQIAKEASVSRSVPPP